MLFLEYLFFKKGKKRKMRKFEFENNLIISHFNCIYLFCLPCQCVFWIPAISSSSKFCLISKCTLARFFKRRLWTKSNPFFFVFYLFFVTSHFFVGSGKTNFFLVPLYFTPNIRFFWAFKLSRSKQNGKDQIDELKKSQRY